MDPRGSLLAVLGHHLLKDELGEVKSAIRDWSGSDPMGSLIDVVMIGSALFLKAEQDENPKVQSMADALTFVSTSLSVGYSDIFPKTEQGKLIATALQMFGPALTAQALEAPHIASNLIEEQTLEAQRETRDLLKGILDELRLAREAREG